MSLDCVRECADQARLDACVQELLTVAVTIREVVWQGQRLGDGSKEVINELALGKLEVREVSSREVLSSGGRLSRGDIKVFGIVGPYAKADGSGQGGLTLDQLDPARTWVAPNYRLPVNRREVEYVLSGDKSGIYYFEDLNTDQPANWVLTLRRTRKTP